MPAQSRFPTGLVLQPGEAVSRIALLNTETGTVGRRPSGARLYHRGSQFMVAGCDHQSPQRLDRAHAWKIIACAEALDAATRTRGQHGGVLKRTGIAVLRALLRGFYSYGTGRCDPSYEAIAASARCCRSTVAAKLRILEQLGIIDTIRRKIVATFTSAVHRVRFSVAVQTSNAYRFNFPHADRHQHGDLALPLLAPIGGTSRQKEAESKIQTETGLEIKTKEEPAPEPADQTANLQLETPPAEFEAVKRYWIERLLSGAR